jgi:hypothetical protein
MESAMNELHACNEMHLKEPLDADKRYQSLLEEHKNICHLLFA